MNKVFCFASVTLLIFYCYSVGSICKWTMFAHSSCYLD